MSAHFRGIRPRDSAPALRTRPGPLTELRVLSYNVHSLRDSPAGVAEVIRACAPDVACIQEAPRFVSWRRRCRELAVSSGLDLVTGGRPAAAMLLLARAGLPVVERRDVKLPWHPPLHRRGLAIGIFDVGGVQVGIATMHLSLDAAERLHQARLVLDIVAALGVPAVLAGDVNETPEGPAWRLLTREPADAYAVAPDGPGETYSAKEPYERIDGIFVDRALDVVSCGVPDLPAAARASDHRPVLAMLRVK